MTTEMKSCVPLIICGQKISTKFMQQLADVYVPAGCSKVKACSAPAVTDVGVKATFQKPLGIVKVPVDAGLQQGHVSLRRIIYKNVGHRSDVVDACNEIW